MKKFLSIVALASVAVATPAQEYKSGISLDNLDQQTCPATDFFQFACGGWVKRNPLPAAYSRYGVFDKLNEDNAKRINGILNDLKELTYPEGTVERKLSDLYKLAVDSAGRERAGIKPIIGRLQQLEEANTVDELFAIQLEMAPYGDNEFFGYYIDADEKEAAKNILSVVQGGTTLRQKEYYLDTDEATTAIREAYKKHIVRMFGMVGYNESAATAKMENVIKLETLLAKASKSMTELRDPEANYNKFTLADFDKRYPHVKLEKQLNAAGVKSEYIQQLVVGQPLFMDAVEQLLSTITPAEYRDYMQWGVIMSSANYLNQAIVEANFDFFGKTMKGRKEMFPLWKRATQQVEGMMGEALGKIYVSKYFPESSKERMKVLVKNLQISLAQRIEAQEWMDESTKKRALDKLNSFYVKIGYPDTWKEMAELSIDPSKSYYENVEECRRYWNRFTIDRKAGKPVDKEEWLISAQTVNAYYNPTTNEICFPAGILQPPFFDAEADDAFNYGAIGVVIGHEMTHGFDDQGRHYDKDGNLTDWWTADDARKFEERANVCVDFFSKIEVLPGLNANGKLTLGENLADHGGLQVAFNAFRNATKGKKLKKLDGFTPEQRFFLSYAGLWAGNINDEEIRNLTKSDPHSLSRLRVNATLPHIDAWYEAFNIKKNSPLFVPKAERVNLW